MDSVYGTVADGLETIRMEWLRHRNQSLSQQKEIRNPPLLESAELKAELTTTKPSSQLKHPERRIVAAIYASHAGSDDRFCRSLESAIAHNVSISLLGWNIPWKGLSQKLEAVYRLATSLPPHDVVLFTDAYDIMFADSEKSILNNFVKMNATIMFSAECGCWPHIMENREVCFTGYPRSPTKSRYLNSGAWIGYAGDAAKMLHAIIQEAGNSFENANDQKLAADMYIEERFGIKLDFFNRIFQAMHYTLDDPLPYCYPRKELEITQQGKWRNKATKSKPAVFHFNGRQNYFTLEHSLKMIFVVGGGKSSHLEMESKMWYKRIHRVDKNRLGGLASSLISLPDNPKLRSLKFLDLCGDYLRKEYRWR